MEVTRVPPGRPSLTISGTYAYYRLGIPDIWEGQMYYERRQEMSFRGDWVYVLTKF